MKWKWITAVRTAPEDAGAKQRMRFILLVAFAGFAAGLIAKATDSISLAGEIGTDLGIWIFAAALIAAFSRTLAAAMWGVPVFFFSMLASYYLYGQVVLGFFPGAYFLGWVAVSLLSPVGGFVAWLSRGKGWVANVCAALPAAVLIAWGYPAFYTFQIPLVLDLLYAAVLLLILRKTWRDRGIALLLSCALALLTERLNLLAYLPW